METITREYYVSFEIAKLLKESGFDWRVRYMYRNNNPTLCICTERTYRNTPKPNKCPMYWQYAAPTLDVAQRWLREVKRIYIEIVTLENKRCVTNSDGWTFHYEYGKPTFDCDIHNERCETISTLDDSFDTYEEAQEAGIKRALEIILEKGGIR